MWILHQNKEAISNINNAVSVKYNCDFTPYNSKIHEVVYCTDNNIISSYVVMGTYPSKEWCLEVIQDIIKNIHLKNPTYEMPKK